MIRKILLLSALLVVSVSFIHPQDSKKTDGEKLKPALLVIDIQNQYLPMVPEREKEVAMYMINTYIQLFRKYNFPVIRIHHSEPGSGPMPGTKEFEFPESVAINAGDPKVIKNHPNSFNNTNLDSILKANKCNTIFLCGLSSVGCVLATYFGGYDIGYNPILLKNALMSHNSDYTKSIEDIFGAVSDQVLLTLLESMK